MIFFKLALFLNSIVCLTLAAPNPNRRAFGKYGERISNVRLTRDFFEEGQICKANTRRCHFDEDCCSNNCVTKWGIFHIRHVCAQPPSGVPSYGYPTGTDYSFPTATGSSYPDPLPIYPAASGPTPSYPTGAGWDYAGNPGEPYSSATAAPVGFQPDGYGGL